MIAKTTNFANALAEARRNTRSTFDDIVARKFVNGGVNQVIDERQIDEWWSKIEYETTKRLVERRDLVNRFVRNMTFDDFWENKCSGTYHCAVYLFYIGTALMLLSSVLYVGTQFYLVYKVTVATYLTGVLLAFTVLFSYGLLLLVKSKIEIARVVVLSLKVSDEVEVKRDDSCLPCCPYWERAILLTPYSQLQPIRVMYKETGEILEVGYNHVRKCKFREGGGEYEGDKAV
jgi:hypothetical protein